MFAIHLFIFSHIQMWSCNWPLINDHNEYFIPNSICVQRKTQAFDNMNWMLLTESTVKQWNRCVPVGCWAIYRKFMVWARKMDLNYKWFALAWFNEYFSLVSFYSKLMHLNIELNAQSNSSSIKRGRKLCRMTGTSSLHTWTKWIDW